MKPAAAAAALLVVVTSAALLARPRTVTVTASDPEARIAALEGRIQTLERQLGDLTNAAEHAGTSHADDQGAGAAPSRLRAPVEVFDDSGQVILRIQRGPAGGGTIHALDSSGGTAALMGAGVSGLAGAIRLMKAGQETINLGYTADGGTVYVNDPSGINRIRIYGSQGVALWDNSGHERVRLGFGDGNRGYVAVRNDKGAEVAHLFESAAGVGNLVTRDGDGQGVQIGTKTRASGAFGDVCATSPKGGTCLSVLAIKAMSPY